MNDLFSHRDSYPDHPGYSQPTTSKAAAASMESSVSHLRKVCLDALARSPGTADEVAERTNHSVLSIRPRFTELSKLGKIVATGERRPNASGRSAKVWRCA